MILIPLFLLKINSDNQDLKFKSVKVKYTLAATYKI